MQSFGTIFMVGVGGAWLEAMEKVVETREKEIWK